METAGSDRAQADGKQGYGAGDCQGELAEVFQTRPGEVEEMIQRRLEERDGMEDMENWQEESEEKLWPATFCVGE